MLELELTPKSGDDESALTPDALDDAHPPTTVPLSIEEIEAEARAHYDRPRFSLRELSLAVIELDIIEQILDAMEGELTPELERRMDAALVTLTESADGIGDFRQAMLIEIAARKAEEQRLAKRRKAMEERLDRVEARFIEYCTKLKRTKIDGRFWTALIRTNAPSLKVHDPDRIGAPYRTERPVIEVEIDNKSLKAALVQWEKDHAAWKIAYEAYAVAMASWDVETQGEPPAAPEEPKRPAPDTAATITRSQSLLLK